MAKLEVRVRDEGRKLCEDGLVHFRVGIDPSRFDDGVEEEE